MSMYCTRRFVFGKYVLDIVVQGRIDALTAYNSERKPYNMRWEYVLISDDRHYYVLGYDNDHALH